jgi:hypothetical protein
MTLRIRRGVEADRTSITPASGEIIYTTDDKRLYVGDGTTAGGTSINNVSGTSATVLPSSTRVFTTESGPNVNVALNIAKRVEGNASVNFDHGGPGLNFVIASGTSGGGQSLGIIGGRYQGTSTTALHDFQFLLLNGKTGSSYTPALTLSKERAVFNGTVKPITFADTTARNAYTGMEDGDLAYLEDNDSGFGRPQMYVDGAWASLVTRNMTGAGITELPSFTLATTLESGAGLPAGAVMTVIRRRTDDTSDAVDRRGSGVLFSWARGATGNIKSIAAINTTYNGASTTGPNGGHKINFQTSNNNFTTTTTIASASEFKFEMDVPVQLHNITTTQRDALSPQAGWMIYNTTANKAQCYNGATWSDLF